MDGDDDDVVLILTQVMSPSGVPVPDDESRFLDGFGEDSHQSLFDEDSEEDLGFEQEVAQRPLQGSRRIAPGEWPEDSFDAQAPSGAAASQGAAASSGAAGRATSPSPLRVQVGTPRPDDERSLLEQLVAILQRQSPQREEGGKSPMLRLAKMPICGDHVLPSVKDWQQSQGSKNSSI